MPQKAKALHLLDKCENLDNEQLGNMVLDAMSSRTDRLVVSINQLGTCWVIKVRNHSIVALKTRAHAVTIITGALLLAPQE